MPTGEAEVQNRIEIADADFLRTMLVPSIKDPAQEITVLLWSDRKIGYTACFGIGLDTGNKLEKTYPVFHKEVEYLVGVVGVYIIEKDKQIEFDFEFAAVFDGAHNTVPCTRTGKIETVMVVIFLRTVNTDSDKEVVLMEKGTPFFVEQDRVGLECVANYLAVFAILLLQSDYFFVEVEAHQSGFTPLPRESGFGKAKLHIILDELFKYFVAHALSPLAYFRCAALVETVFAIHVAIGTRWFYQQCKWLHSFPLLSFYANPFGPLFVFRLELTGYLRAFVGKVVHLGPVFFEVVKFPRSSVLGN